MDCPFLHGNGVYGFVKLDRRLIPIEDPPLEATTPPFFRKARQVGKHRSAYSVPTHVRFHEQILEIDAWSAEERREIVKKQGETYGFSMHIANYDFCHTSITKKSFAQNVFGCDDFMRQFLILCQVLYER
jgi:hypothetical protein